jgi:hypothetical protein
MSLATRADRPLKSARTGGESTGEKGAPGSQIPQPLLRKPEQTRRRRRKRTLQAIAIRAEVLCKTTSRALTTASRGTEAGRSEASDIHPMIPAGGGQHVVDQRGLLRRGLSSGRPEGRGPKVEHGLGSYVSAA